MHVGIDKTRRGGMDDRSIRYRRDCWTNNVSSDCDTFISRKFKNSYQKTTKLIFEGLLNMVKC